jgi:hypothetical protein
MKKIILLFFVVFSLQSCNEKKQGFINQLSFDKLLSESDQIVIKLYDSTEVKQQSRGVESWNPKKTYNVAGKEIVDFKNILENSENTEYCCCPISSYSVSYYKNNKELEIFYADTLEFKDRVRIYEGSYQYSYIIEKQKWKSFLSKVEK